MGHQSVRNSLALQKHTNLKKALHISVVVIWRSIVGDHITDRLCLHQSAMSRLPSL